MITMDKKYQTRKGQPVRILCTDRAENNKLLFPVVGLLPSGIIATWQANGSYSEDKYEHERDLIEIKPKMKVDLVVLGWERKGGNWFYRTLGSGAGVDESIRALRTIGITKFVLHNIKEELEIIQRD